MRAHQIMTKPVITIAADATILEAANIMLEQHISGLPVVDATGLLVGMVTQGDFIHRGEIGTERRRSRWLQFIQGSGKAATDFVHEHGCKVSEVMSRPPVTITEDTPLADIADLMEKKNIKRLPVLRNGELVGIVTRTNLLQAVASLARHVADPTADDDHIRERIIRTIEKADWQPIGLNVVVRDGIVHLSGIITDEDTRQAIIVAAENVEGVRKVHDHLSWVDVTSGMYLNSAEDEEMAKAS